MAALFPGLLCLAWATQSTRFSGVIIGALAGLKLSPGSLAGWVLASGRAGMAGLALGLGACFLACVLGASPGAIPEYIQVVWRGIGPSWLSLSSLSGIPWLSPAVMLTGTVCSAVLGPWPAASFAVGVLSTVIGTPALYLSGFVTLLALLAPLAWPARSGDEKVQPRQVAIAAVRLPPRYAFARGPWLRRP
jgi:hypothetical protein